MALNTNKPTKLYYSIKEVAQMMNVSESLLRYWETEFPHLRPKTTGNRVRQYTQKDIEQIKVIYNLVKVRGFKIAAARKMLQVNRSGADKSQQVIESLTAVRDELKDLKKSFSFSGTASTQQKPDAGQSSEGTNNPPVAPQTPEKPVSAAPEQPAAESRKEN